MNDYPDSMKFTDRADAGIRLADALLHIEPVRPVVLGIARGGVEIGFRIAQKFRVPLSVLVVRKIGAPGNSELGVGAISEGNVTVFHTALMKQLNISQKDLIPVLKTESAELSRRVSLYRGGAPLPDLTGRAVILADDGLATGYTMKAAIESVRALNPRKITVAVPVCTGESADSIRSEVGDFVCLVSPEPFSSVGKSFLQFGQVTDDDVIRLLAESRKFPDES
jgi:predicted phosphoribosyltransferase